MQHTIMWTHVSLPQTVSMPSCEPFTSQIGTPQAAALRLETLDDDYDNAVLLSVWRVNVNN